MVFPVLWGSTFLVFVGRLIFQFFESFNPSVPSKLQVEIVKKCRQLGLGPGGFYQPGYKDGAKLRLQMMCLGRDWDPETRKYGSRRTIDGTQPPGIPHEFSLLVERAIEEAHAHIKEELRVSSVEEILPSISPDICIANFYTTSGRLGLHQVCLCMLVNEHIHI